MLQQSCAENTGLRMMVTGLARRDTDFIQEQDLRREDSRPRITSARPFRVGQIRLVASLIQVSKSGSWPACRRVQSAISVGPA